MFTKANYSRNLIGMTFANRFGGEEESPTLHAISLADHICNCFGTTKNRGKWNTKSVEMEIM